VGFINNGIDDAPPLADHRLLFGAGARSLFPGCMSRALLRHRLRFWYTPPVRRTCDGLLAAIEEAIRILEEQRESDPAQR